MQLNSLLANRYTASALLFIISGSLLFTFLILIFLAITFFPITICIAVAYKYTRLHKLIQSTYDYFFYQSEKPRKILWGLMYDLMCGLFPLPKWRAMNYGYAVINTNGQFINNLDEQQEEERFCLQLYYYVATQFMKQKTLQGKRVLEVGSGRGGGLYYISQNLDPEQCVGVDFSQNQVDFCNRTYNYDKLNFRQGDAENLEALNFEEKFDIIINIESSHCYGNFRKFVQSATNQLKQNGYFIIADFRAVNEFPNFEQQLQSSGLKLIEKQDITINVKQALKLDEGRKLQWMHEHCNFILRPLFKKFSGVQSSRIYQEFNNRSSLYQAYVLQKV